jgi:hypothetical protein
MVLIVVGAGCASEPGSPGPTTVTFGAPAPGATFTRDVLGEAGALVADVPVQLELGGEPPARVSLAIGDVELGDSDASGALDVHLPVAGPATLVATAYDTAGAPLATASVDVTIAEPEVADCHGWLDLYRLEYTLGPANPGVADPVTVKVPINGITYRYTENTAPRPKFMMDCLLAKSLAEAAPHLRARDVVEVADYGVYNYRCIGDGTPPDCPHGMSQHAYAKAIDLVAFKTTDSTTYTVKTDFVIDPATEKTCSAATEPGSKDAWLHDTICELKRAQIWNIVLTPNYNADHRDHFHVDLTPDSDFIRSRPHDDPTAIFGD